MLGRGVFDEKLRVYLTSNYICLSGLPLLIRTLINILCSFPLQFCGKSSNVNSTEHNILLECERYTKGEETSGRYFYKFSK